MSKKDKAIFSKREGEKYRLQQREIYSTSKKENDKRYRQIAVKTGEEKRKNERQKQRDKK